MTSPRFLLLPLLFLALGSIASPAPLRAQSVSPAEAVLAGRAAVRRLAYMAGDWQGTGWILRGSDRHEFRGGERVQVKLDTLALLVEGRFTIRLPDGREVPVHETLGVISFDREAGSYRFATWLASGGAGTHPLEVRDDGWSWEIDSPRGRVRYSATFADDTWHEVGELLSPGSAPRRFFEMTLRKR